LWREKHFRLDTSAATALATILELTLSRQSRRKLPRGSVLIKMALENSISN